MAKQQNGGRRSRWIVLSQLAIVMGVTIYLGAQLGKYLDNHYKFGEKGFTITCTLTATVLAFYYVLKQVNRLNEQEDEKRK